MGHEYDIIQDDDIVEAKSLNRAVIIVVLVKMITGKWDEIHINILYKWSTNHSHTEQIM